VTRGTIAYVLQRAVLIGLTALAVSSIVFLGVHQLPGTAFVNERNPNPAAQAALLHHYHLDLPLAEQYGLWITGVLHGDLGESLVNRGEPITPLILREASVSATLGIFALVITVGLGLLLGSLAALKQNTWIDHLSVSSAIFAYSVPNFVWATLLVLLTVTGLYHLSGGAFYEDIGWGKPEQIPVPALCLGLPYAGFVARLTRASLLEVLRQDYIRTAYAKGLREKAIVIRHALPNALIPVVSILGPLVTGILTGSVVIENIFGIPGLGKEFVTSIVTRDYNIVIAVFTFYAVLIGLANLLVDLVYPILDPRISY
jgi:ABC-type dipeptide/oligopeptide/nickel transport system permease component